MSRRYTLYDYEINYPVSTFDDRQSAMRFVQGMIRTFPRDMILDLSLNWRDGDEIGEEIWGDELLAIAEQEGDLP